MNASTSYTPPEQWELSKEEKLSPPKNPVRYVYTHLKCMYNTRTVETIAQTIARKPTAYKQIFCHHCKAHFPVSEFVWSGTHEKLGE